MTDDFAARRAAVLERLARKRKAARRRVGPPPPEQRGALRQRGRDVSENFQTRSLLIFTKEDEQ